MSTTGDWADDMLKVMAEHAAHTCCDHDIHENYCLCCMDSCPNSEGFYDEAEEHTGDDDDTDRNGNICCGASFMASTICTRKPGHDGAHAPLCQTCGGDWWASECTCPADEEDAM